jgi:hypothetical protein
MAVKLSVVVFWILMQCGVVGGYQCFIGMYWLRIEGWTEDGGDTFLWSAGNFIPDYTVPHHIQNCKGHCLCYSLINAVVIHDVASYCNLTAFKFKLTWCKWRCDKTFNQKYMIEKCVSHAWLLFNSLCVEV